MKIAEQKYCSDFLFDAPCAAPLVLLVEDNVVALHLIEAMTKQAGLNTLSAIDGEQALELATSKEFDLIITDIGLPGISGYELTHAIRQWEKAHHKTQVPIIGLTAHLLRDSKEESFQVGMNNILCKPINLKSIQELTQQFIRSVHDLETIPTFTQSETTLERLLADYE